MTRSALAAISMQSEPTRQRRTPTEVAADLVLLATELRAGAVGHDARRARASECESIALLQLCLRLRHHLHEMQRAIGRTRQQCRARTKAVALVRAAIEQQLDRSAQAHDEVRPRIVARLAVARTKFVMSSKADALAELALRTASHEPRWRRADASLHAAEIARTHLAGLWVRTVTLVHTPVVAFATRLCADVEHALGELGEGLHPDALIDVVPHPLGTFDDEMTARLRRLRPDLATLLVEGSEAIAQRLLAYYDHALCSLDARLRERLDGLEATSIAAASFAADALDADGRARAQQRVVAWSGRLAQLIEDIP